MKMCRKGWERMFRRASWLGLLIAGCVAAGCGPRDRFPYPHTVTGSRYLLFDRFGAADSDMVMQRLPWPVTYLAPDASNQRDYEVFFMDQAGLIQNNSRGQSNDHSTIRRVIEVRGGIGASPQ